jgi:hypothetical protein
MSITMIELAAVEVVLAQDDVMLGPARRRQRQPCPRDDLAPLGPLSATGLGFASPPPPEREDLTRRTDFPPFAHIVTRTSPYDTSNRCQEATGTDGRRVGRSCSTLWRLRCAREKRLPNAFELG